MLRRLLRHQGTHFGDFVELVVARLLDCTRSSDREVMHASERTLDLLVTVVEPSRSLQVRVVSCGEGMLAACLLPCLTPVSWAMVYAVV